MEISGYCSVFTRKTWAESLKPKSLKTVPALVMDVTWKLFHLDFLPFLLKNKLLRPVKTSLNLNIGWFYMSIFALLLEQID